MLLRGGGWWGGRLAEAPVNGGWWQPVARVPTGMVDVKVGLGLGGSVSSCTGRHTLAQQVKEGEGEG